MLRLEDIKKIYKTKNNDVLALKGITLAFRKNEFVSILGKSGCGKTTMLNIIGGLDKYTSGDLFIEHKSTKNYKDKDFDDYRNKKIGFVFQAYNLINHLTVLENVTLSLKISGIKKEEQKELALKALDKVGLLNKANSYPTKLSGGQCQRVAIARAIVNNPEILLLDEPTGALDSKTSLDIMNLIKEISKDKLIIMVTHNNELAQMYSNRIITLSDGEVINDTNPYSIDDEKNEVYKEVIENKKSKMTFFQAFKLSFKNLLTKRLRTILTCIAGSIGIIGISLVLSIQVGVKKYISKTQEEMLLSTPIQIKDNDINISSLLSSLSYKEKLKLITGQASIEQIVKNFFTQTINQDTIISNEITNDYVKFINDMPKSYYNNIAYGYGFSIAPYIFTNYMLPTQTESYASLDYIYNSLYQSIISYNAQAQDIIASLTSYMLNYYPYGGMYVDNEQLVLDSYSLEAGSLPKEKNEAVIVLSSDQSISDVTLLQLGYMQINDVVLGNKKNIPYTDLLNKTFYYGYNDQLFTETTSSPVKYTYNNKFIDATNLNEIKVVGVLKQKPNVKYGFLNIGLNYMPSLVDDILLNNQSSKIVDYIKSQNDQIKDESLITYTVDYYDLSLYKVQTTPALNYYRYTESSSIGGIQVLPSTSNLPVNIRTMGGNSTPSSIYIYAKDFDLKNSVTSYLEKWNQDGDITLSDGTVIPKDLRKSISYSDSLSLIIDSIDQMINLMTFSLISLTSLSLVVSCVMIAIITYVSVMERTKEIGIIRSIGGRKKDVSNLFNAETLIIGFTSGVFGITVTFFLSIIINIIVRKVGVGIDRISILNIQTTIVMILLSVFLTMLSGLIPARLASKKDPAVSLRTE